MAENYGTVACCCQYGSESSRSIKRCDFSSLSEHRSLLDSLGVLCFATLCLGLYPSLDKYGKVRSGEHRNSMGLFMQYHGR
jgi:hypothetical protein